MRVFCTGAAGYLGHVLVPLLLERGCLVTVFDAMWYPCHLPNSPNLTIIRGDIRDEKLLARALEWGYDAVIHLACISNDASFELDEALSRTINYDAFEPLVRLSAGLGVKRFIYASTSSVYGISDAAEVTEDHPLVPLTLYNKYKAMCEPILDRYAREGFTTVTVRPATLCGYSPRQRLDLAVNALTNHAYARGEITVYGGAQMRPNLHVEDMAEVYELLLRAPAHKIHHQIFNVGGENLSLADLAERVAEICAHTRRPEIKIVPSSDDTRSYRINSDKIRDVLGYRPKRSVERAVGDLWHALQNHLLPDSLEDDRYYNVRRMKALGVR